MDWKRVRWEDEVDWSRLDHVVQLTLAEERREDPLIVSFDAVISQH